MWYFGFRGITLWSNTNFILTKKKRYIDWGTQSEWMKYTSQYKTLFVDIDGTLIYNSGEYFSP